MNILDILNNTDPDSDDRFAVSSLTFANELSLHCEMEFDIQNHGYYQVPFRKFFDHDQEVGESVLFYKGKPIAIVAKDIRNQVPTFVWVDQEIYETTRRDFQKVIFKKTNSNGPRWTIDEYTRELPDEGYSIGSFEHFTRDMEIINMKTGEPFEFPANGWQIDWKMFAKKTGISPYDLIVKYQNQIEN